MEGGFFGDEGATFLYLLREGEMPVEHKLIHCKMDDPNRCKASTQNPCIYLAVEGTDYCPRHGAFKVLSNQEKESIRMYRVAQWQERIGDFANHDKVKSLREEVGVLRMTLEAVLNKCQDAAELVMMSGKISAMVRDIEKVVSSCHRLETASGQLLDKSAAMNFAQQIIVIVGQHVTDPDKLELITDEISKSLTAQAPNGAPLPVEESAA